MGKEDRILLEKSIDSLILSIERFNSPHELGRATSFLILMDHSFEMFLKASILKKGGKIREPRQSQTIGFQKCINKCLLDSKTKFLSREEALTLQTINGLRDAAQHYVIDVSEQQLYLHAQSGITLYNDLLKRVFNQDLCVKLPSRVMPISTTVPQDICGIFVSEIDEIRKLLSPGKRKKQEAYLRIRPLAVLEGTIGGKTTQPSAADLRNIGNSITEGKTWEEIFPGSASITFVQEPIEGTLTVNLRLAKKEGIPVEFAEQSGKDRYPLVVKRVNEISYYSLSRDDLAKHLQISGPKTTALIWYLKLKNDKEYYKEFEFKSVIVKRYSQQALTKMRETIATESIDQIWDEYKSDMAEKQRKKRNSR